MILTQNETSTFCKKPTPDIYYGLAKLGISKYGLLPANKSHPRKVFEALLFNQIKHLDTAEIYGSANQIIADWNNKYPGYFSVSTKISGLDSHSDLDPLKILSRISRILNDLYISKIDILYLHQPLTPELRNQGIIEVLIEAKNLGYIDAIGVSIYDKEELDYCMSIPEISTIQLPVNLYDSSLMQRGQRFQSSKRFIARSILLQGQLTLDRSNVQSKDHQESISSFLVWLNDFAKKHRTTVMQLTISYLKQYFKLSGIILGTARAQRIHEFSEVFKSNDEIPFDLDRLHRWAMKPKASANPRNW